MDINLWQQVFVSVVLFTLKTFCQKLDNNIPTEKGPRVVSVHIRSDIVYRFAETVVTSTVVNELYDAREATFDVSLPMAAFISNFTLQIDGIVYPGIVKEKEEAKKVYEKAKRKGQSAGHVTSKPRDSSTFRVTINVAPQSEVTFVLIYDELLQRKRGQYEHIIFIDPKMIVDSLLVEVYIYESREITALRIPPVANTLMSNPFHISTSNELAIVERPSPQSAYIRYNPSPQDQMRMSPRGISGLFKIMYDVQRSLDAGDLFVVNGYFTHFFAPVGLTPISKRILFVLDVSGSMELEDKIHQLKAAMVHILKDLKEEDLFNIVEFHSWAQPWSQTMMKATKDNIEEAMKKVQELQAEGGTNVNDAMLDAIDILQRSNDYNSGLSAPIIVFLTDGDPTVGVVKFKNILNNIQERNQHKIQIFSLAFGGDANFDFLKKMSARNDAFARKIYAEADAALQLTGFYSEISNVLLSKVSFTYLDDTVNLTTVSQTQFPSFFDGSELVVAGQINEDAEDFNTISLSVVGQSENGMLELHSSQEFHAKKASLPEFKTRLNFEMITERIWAYLTVKKLLGDMLKTENNVLKKEIKQDAINLALKYNFVTPVTSMVVTKPEPKKTNRTNDMQEDDANALEQDDQDEEKDPANNLIDNMKGGKNSQSLTGKGTSVLPPALADSDPHFIVNVKGLEYAVCFDVMGEEGYEYQLIHDQYSGVDVTAKVVANKQKVQKTDYSDSHHHGEIKTFLGEISVTRWKFNITVTPTNITLNQETIDWNNGTTLSHGKTKVVIDTEGSMLVIIFKDKIAFLIMRHLRPEKLLKQGKVNFLGIYIVEDRGLSYHTHGLLGQFLHRDITLKKTKTRKGRLMGRLRVSGNTRRARKVMASLGHRLNMATNQTVSCWMVQHNGGALLDGNITDYLINYDSVKDKIHTLE